MTQMQKCFPFFSNCLQINLLGHALLLSLYEIKKIYEPNKLNNKKKTGKNVTNETLKSYKI